MMSYTNPHSGFKLIKSTGATAIKNQREYTNLFANKQFIERTIGGAINGKKLAGG
jgi:hypothetical protein